MYNPSFIIFLGGVFVSDNPLQQFFDWLLNWLYSNSMDRFINDPIYDSYSNMLFELRLNPVFIRGCQYLNWFIPINFLTGLFALVVTTLSVFMPVKALFNWAKVYNN